VGDPYLNFGLSIIVELCAIVACQFTLERFGRKVPYSLNMTISGVCLISVMFVPTSMPYLVTVLALIGKFAISFTYNGIYIITGIICNIFLHP
jgi:OCT family organic cation transporter-like MFS transporter 4/5